MAPRQPHKSFKASVRDYAGGVRPRDLPALWRRDWQRAYGIITRDHPDDEEPRGWLRRWWYRSKTLFIEFSARLSPPRRLLFAISLLLAVLGLQTENVEVGTETIRAWEHPILLFFSVLGLLFLLVLELADRIQVRDELEVARQLQRDLMPREAPAIADYRFAFSYRSANTVGGDYYEFLPLADGRLALAAGDASGHGIAAAMLMAISNATLRLAVDTDPEPLAVAAMMNRALTGTGGPRAFLTLFYALLEPASGRLDYVCAGHPFPLLRRRDGEIRKLGKGSFPLGLRPRLELAAGRDEIRPGDLLLLYTDGIPEALGEEGEAFGFERLQRCLERAGTPQEVHDRIVAEIERFENRGEHDDDQSLVVIGRSGRDEGAA
jgi:sigma-B regulation protein RsbU (phosphoserine phosphatase)